MNHVCHVAKYILRKTGAISPWKLQKLCFYVQAWSLVWTNEPLFPEDFCADRNGPTCKELLYKTVGHYLVSEELFDDIDIDFTDDEIETIDIVLQAYGSMESHDLYQQVCSEFPWKKTRGNLSFLDHSSEIISKEVIREYYGSLR